ncbi:MAG: response regulator [Peptococcaceae bacterium]|nr:response regulator [Peptococcaceae bacterium]
MQKDLIMLVEDNETNRVVLKGILRDEYDIIEAADGAEAVEILMNSDIVPSLMLLDILMPVMDGYELLKFMKGHVKTVGIPVIIISGVDPGENEMKALKLGAVDFIPKPFVSEVVKIRVSNHVRLKNYSEALEMLVEKKMLQITDTREKILETMANIIEYRNLESGHHVRRTRKLTEILIDHVRRHREYGVDISVLDQEIYAKAVPLHDIGKIAIPDNILLKPGRLTLEEFEVIKTHAPIGSEIIGSLLHSDKDIYLTCCYEICRYHHERWDGKGYPDGLSGKDIPLSARMLAIVDVYDALVSSRIYKGPYSHEKAVGIISQGMNSQFDPTLVTAFLEVEKKFEIMK